MKEYSYREIKRFRKINLLHQILNGGVWASSGRHVLLAQSGNQFRRYASFPFQFKCDLLSGVRPAARATRSDRCNVYQNCLGNVIGIRQGIVYRVEKTQMSPLGQINGDSVLPGCMCEDSAGCIYFGEYFRNQSRGPVKIWKVSPNAHRMEVAHEFPAGEIRHVHGVFADPFSPSAIWVTSGDLQGECYLFHTNDRFCSLNKIGGGGQLWRAVKLHFTQDHINWLTDSHVETNHACRISRDSLELEVGQEIPASVWFGEQTTEGKYVAFTTVEPGPGIKTGVSEILISDDAFHWKSVYGFKKDFWRPMSVFKFGVISCPRGLMSLKKFFISGEGLVGLDGTTLEIELV